MPWFAIIGLICFVLGVSLGVAVVAGRVMTDRPPLPPQRPQTGARVIRDPRFGLGRHEHDWRGDDE